MRRSRRGLAHDQVQLLWRYPTSSSTSSGVMQSAEVMQQGQSAAMRDSRASGLITLDAMLAMLARCLRCFKKTHPRTTSTLPHQPSLPPPHPSSPLFAKMQHASHIDSRGSQDIKYEHGDHLTGTLSPNSVESNVLAVHPDEGFDESEIKSIRRKIDWRLVPPLAALYAMSLIDRTNISLAAQAGMSRQLRLTIEDRYAHAVLAFFPPYIAFELLSNIGLRKVGARFWLPSAGVLWGISMLGMGFVNNVRRD